MPLTVPGRHPSIVRSNMSAGIRAGSNPIAVEPSHERRVGFGPSRATRSAGPLKASTGRTKGGIAFTA